MTKKYNVPVFMRATASVCIGHIKCDSMAEYREKAQILFEKNDAPDVTEADVSDWDLEELSKENIKYFRTRSKTK